MNNMGKVCSKCGVEKPQKDFYRGPQKDGFRAWCKSCCSTSNRRSRSSHPPTEDQLEKRSNYMKEYKRTPKFRRLNAERKRALPLEKHMLRAAKERAKKKGISFDLTLEDLCIPDVCPLLGIPLVRSRGRTSPNSPSLDRKNPALGYTKENVWIISWRANRIKQDATGDEIRQIALKLTEAGI